MSKKFITKNLIKLCKSTITCCKTIPRYGSGNHLPMWDKNFWKEHTDNKERMYYVFRYPLSLLQEQLPDFKIANAVIHFDEASPHMHVVCVPIGYGAKRGLPKKVSKRKVFTLEKLSTILQGSLREEAEKCFEFNIKEEFGEMKKGRNHDLSVVEYKVAKETEHLSEVIQAGNSFRGLLFAIGELLKSFKEFIVDGICWFPRLMRWNTSKGEVAPVFCDYKNEGYDYRLKAYMNVVTKKQYSIESIHMEIKAENRVGTLEQLEQGIVAAEKLIEELRLDKKYCR